MNSIELKETIKLDLYRYTKNISRIEFFKNLMRNPGFKYTYFLRKCQYYSNKNKFYYIFYKLVLRRLKLKLGYEISDKIQIGKGLYINHLGGIAVNPKVRMGNNINLT